MAPPQPQPQARAGSGSPTPSGIGSIPGQGQGHGGVVVPTYEEFQALRNLTYINSNLLLELTGFVSQSMALIGNQVGLNINFPQILVDFIHERGYVGTMSPGAAERIEVDHDLLATQNAHPGVDIEPLDDSVSEEGPISLIDLEQNVSEDMKVFRTPASSSMQQELDPQDGNCDEQNVEEVEHDGNRQVELNTLGNRNWVANSIANLQDDQVRANVKTEQINVGGSGNIQTKSVARRDDGAIESGFDSWVPLADVELVCDEDDDFGSESSTHTEAVDAGDEESSVDHRAPKNRVGGKETNSMIVLRTRSQTRQINEPNQEKLAKQTPIASSSDSQLDTPRSWSRFKKRAGKSKRKSKLSCQVCGKLCTNKSHLGKHLNGIHHVRILSLKCGDCEKEFANPEYLRRHRKKVHNPDRKSVNCAKCNREFVDEATLKKHLPLHESPKFQCPHCPKLFHLKTSLPRHISTHFYRPPLECSECHSEFLDQSSLRRHFLGHMQN